LFNFAARCLPFENMKQLGQLIISIFLILISNALWSQQSYYSCYTGENNDMQYRLHLVNANNKLNANFLIKEKATEATELTLQGKIDAAGDFYLGQNYGEDTILFGRLTQSRLEAYLRPNKSALLLLRLQAESSENHLPLKIITLEQQQALDTANPDSPQAIFEGQLLFPRDRNTLLDSLFMLQPNEIDSSKTTIPDELLALQADSFFAGYKKLNSFENQDSPVFQWIKMSEVFVQLNQNQLLSYAIADYAYTGGAHGLSTKQFTVLDIKNMKQLSPADIFRPEALDNIPALLEKNLRLQYQISADSSLRSAGFFIDELEITGNFWLSPAGIGFYYNSYEIAPYSFGHTPILLPFSQLDGLLKPEFVSRLLPIQESLNPQP
jgi:hypothetical protein